MDGELKPPPENPRAADRIQDTSLVALTALKKISPLEFTSHVQSLRMDQSDRRFSCPVGRKLVWRRYPEDWQQRAGLHPQLAGWQSHLAVAVSGKVGGAVLLSEGHDQRLHHRG